MNKTINLSSPNSDDRGFSLIESLIAISLIGTALIISSALLNSLVYSADHLRAHTVMLREIEASIEMMRAGFVPLESGTLSSAGSNSHFPDLRVNAVVEKQDAPGLYLVIVRAECSVRRNRVSRSLTTQMWRE